MNFKWISLSGMAILIPCTSPNKGILLENKHRLWKRLFVKKNRGIQCSSVKWIGLLKSFLHVKLNLYSFLQKSIMKENLWLDCQEMCYSCISSMNSVQNYQKYIWCGFLMDPMRKPILNEPPPRPWFHRSRKDFKWVGALLVVHRQMGMTILMPLLYILKLHHIGVECSLKGTQIQMFVCLFVCFLACLFVCLFNICDHQPQRSPEVR